MYWVKYWADDTIVKGAKIVKCRLFYDYNNAVDFCNTLYSGELIKYDIPGY